jgi:hypothetical protein
MNIIYTKVSRLFNDVGSPNPSRLLGATYDLVFEKITE